MARTALEEQLSAIAREFVERIVEAIRHASFADVASFSAGQLREPAAATPARARPAKRSGSSASNGVAAHAPVARSRQSAEKRAELGARLLQVLTKAGEPMGVRALATELKVAPDRLALPLKELRSAGKVTKHGDKRNTRYAAA
jgi:hypothetical protein